VDAPAWQGFKDLISDSVSPDRTRDLNDRASGVVNADTATPTTTSDTAGTVQVSAPRTTIGHYIVRIVHASSGALADSRRRVVCMYLPSKVPIHNWYVGWYLAC
jgi:hypothetical protein